MLNFSLSAPDCVDISLEEAASELDVFAFLIRSCMEISDAYPVDFRISGFGQDLWPLEARVELSIFLMEVPSLIRWITTNEESKFALEFYEQGMERTILFTQEGEWITAKGVDFPEWDKGKWQPDPDTEMLLKSVLLEQLVSCLRAFLKLVGKNMELPSVRYCVNEWLQPLPEYRYSDSGLAVQS